MTPEQEAELARKIEEAANRAAASLAPAPIIRPSKSNSDEDIVNDLLAQTQNALIKDVPIRNYR